MSFLNEGQIQEISPVRKEMDRLDTLLGKLSQLVHQLEDALHAALVEPCQETKNTAEGKALEMPVSPLVGELRTNNQAANRLVNQMAGLIDRLQL